ncbi:hypothetical protein E1B28_004030 [Marasmius oreades]|uniref:Uncharacterized protein n=1 Tax=Marasmius oreades TaxID=181124 RepID=A0A9P8ACK2_9AGAR|nr:uncharacterized protein E1B28_004030 [Marasmius oreades]KAG7096613.1 hypothetical protein E1B28_004030 [Marasmius oreades]
MARPGAPRLHRLPQRLDYTLIPAPLDISLPHMTEKSPLPAIIVTPSSPSAEHRFSIAFLAPPLPPSKPSLRERLSSTLFSFKTRTALLLLVICFVMICHLVAHKMATHRPHLDLDFAVQDAEATRSVVGEWFGSLWGDGDHVPVDNKREYIVMEPL